MTADMAPEGRRSWGEALAVYTRPSVVRMLFFGFSAGLPFLLMIFLSTTFSPGAGVALESSLWAELL